MKYGAPLIILNRMTLYATLDDWAAWRPLRFPPTAIIHAFYRCKVIICIGALGHPRHIKMLFEIAVTSMAADGTFSTKLFGAAI